MTPDVNVLVAASRADHPHHRPALTWLEQALSAATDAQPLAILPMVASGFLRLVTHPRVFVEPTPADAAWAFLRAILTAPGVVLISLGDEWDRFEQLCTHHGLTANAIPDAWIAAAAHYRHLHLVTFDRGFRKLMRPYMLTVLSVESM